ncbi:hypothetical protein [Paraburkholderia sp. J41]|uniref:hypothetical protein n=1 Tax=Paraburkholderia sp. J41 TaxID=2805433 RepID=UPI002AC369B7|nr:hypothetical protein [Paraburkholderia sp. J41]
MKARDRAEGKSGEIETQRARRAASTRHLVEKVRAAADKQAKKAHAHCHCEVHRRSPAEISVRIRTVIRIILTLCRQTNPRFPDEGFSRIGKRRTIRKPRRREARAPPSTDSERE